jgi:hypothetical protein
MQKAFVESMKTIVKSAVERAGFDKTRNGKVVGVNSVTNTYSVKVDGIIYNNVRTVNDTTCNVGDTVKVNIPMNNPSQTYITSSILSDDSIGKKLAQATTAIDEINNNIDSIVEIMGNIYQLSIGVTYKNRTVGSQTYVDATYTAILTQDGVDVTQQHQPSEFRWYLEKTTGKTNIANARSVTLSTENYLYGQAVMLEWELDEQPTLRSRVTLFNEVAVEEVAKYTTEITNGGVFVHRADGNYDVGSDWESVWAYGVKIANTVDIIKGGRIYGSFGGSYLTIGNTSENNIYMDSSGFIQLRNSSTVLADIRSGSITLGRTASSYYNVYMDTQNLYFRQGTTQLGSISSSQIILGKTNTYNTLINTSGMYVRYGTNVTVADFTSGGITLKNISGYTTFSANANAINLYTGTASNVNLASFNTSGITLRNSSGYLTFTAGQNAMNLYTGTASNVALASFSTTGLTLRNSSGTELMSVAASSLRVGDIGFWSRGTGGLLGMYIAGPSGWGDDMNLYVSGHTGYLEASNGTLHLGSSATEVVLGTSGDLFRPSDDDSTNLGTSSYRWKKVYAKSSSISTSDRKEKDILGDIDFAYDLIMSLKPIHYMWKKGDRNRTWMGFIAQDIAKWAKNKDLNLGLYTASYKDEEENPAHREYHGEIVDDKLLNWGLAYSELIAPLVQVVQDQQKTIKDLSDRISQLEQKE